MVLTLGESSPSVTADKKKTCPRVQCREQVIAASQTEMETRKCEAAPK